MKKIVALILLSVFAFASHHTSGIKAEILSKIFSNISLGKEIVIWSDNQNLSAEFDKKGNFATAKTCQDATLLIVENKKLLDKGCSNKAIFVLDYALLNDIEQSFGAIFWKKGRPNIVILAPRAKAQSISISDALSDYVEEKVW